MNKRHLVWAVILVLATFGIASAQETTTGSIQGTVLDQQGAAVPGATVTITSTQGAKSFVTDANGKFFAPFLTPGRVSAKVELTGFSTVEQKNIDIRLGVRLDLTFTMKVGGIQDVVEVVGTAPTVDTNSTTAGGVLDSDTLRKLPVGRNFTDTLYLVPGVSNSGVGNSNPSVGGASGLENNYVVDGVNITNTGYGAVGSYSIVFGSLGTGVTSDFIKETQVKTAGFEAEYGQSTGGVINVVTQSGTNKFHGSVFGYWRPASLESSYESLTTPNGTVLQTGSENADVGLTIGGPLLKDKLFFFGAVNPQWQTATFTAPNNKTALGTDQFKLASLGEVDRKRRVLSYAGKLTWQASTNHRIDLSAFGDPSKGDNGPQRAVVLRQADTSGFSELSKYGGHNQVVKYDGIISRNWLIEASFARAQNTIEEIPSVDEWRVTDTTVVPNRTTGGIGFYEQGNDGTNKQYQFKSTNIFEAAGNHQIRYGVAFEDINYQNINQRTGPTFTLANGIVTKTGAQISILADPNLGRVYRVTRANYENVRNTNQNYLNFFLQDTWQIGKKLTLRPGVRYEEQKLIGDDATPLCHANDSVPGAGDGTGEAVPCEIKWDGNWSPRLGATYDIKGDGRSKLYVSYGKFFAKIPNDLAARALSADAGVSRADYFDAGLTQPIPNGTLAAGTTTHLTIAGTGASKINPDSKSSYTEEFLGGFEVEVGHNINVGVRYIHRTVPVILEDYQPAPIVAFDLGCPGAESVEYLIDNISPNIPKFHCTGIPDASFEDPVHKYDAFELTVNKAFSNNWSMQASYRYAKLKGNYEGFFRNDNGQSDPSITSLFDFPTNDPSYTQVGVPQFGYRGDIRFLGATLGNGPLPNDRPHQLKIYANRAWGSLNTGMGFNLGSGKPLTRLAANPNYQSGGEIPETLRGEGIQTTYDGFLSSTNQDLRFDLHADYSFKFGEQRLQLIADVFNLFNNQDPNDYDNWTESTFGAPNPNYGQPVNGGASSFTSFRTPRQIRVGARFEW